MDNELLEKLIKNSFTLERMNKLTREERQSIIVELLKTHTTRALAIKLGVTHTTIGDWKTMRQSNTGADLHLSMASIYRKLSNLKPEQITDWGRIEMIKEECERLLKYKKGGW